MSKLDDVNNLKALDPDNMLGAIAGLPDQIQQAAQITPEPELNPADFKGLKNIIHCGMGGSAIGGDMVRSLLQDSLLCPMQVCRNYNLPEFAGPDTLVIGSSYSGNTEETLSAFGQAVKKGCRLLVLTTGGKIGEIAREHKIPTAILPKGYQPRAALGFSFVPLMLLFEKIGLSEYAKSDFLALADFLSKNGAVFNDDADAEDNPAKQIAQRLYGRIPIIYSGPELTDMIGIRIKGQICENAKMLAFANQFPEFNHNELVGWKLKDAFRDSLRVMIIRNSEDHPRVAARMDIVTGLLEKQKVDVITITSKGKNRLERMFSLVQLGDFISYYLALLNKVDPTPVEPIENLKEALAALQ